MLSSENLWNQIKANNSNNNIVRVYGDVIHTGQTPGLKTVRLVRTTLKLSGLNVPREHDEGFKMSK